MKRLGNRGETLMETLCAVLIIVVLLVGLTSAIMASAQISRTAKADESHCTMDRSGGALNGVSAKVGWSYGGASGEAPLKVQLYRDGEYYFYEVG